MFAYPGGICVGLSQTFLVRDSCVEVTDVVNSLRFSVPGVAAEAVNVSELWARAQEAGVTAIRLSYHFAYRVAGDRSEYRCYIMCSAQMGVFLIEQLRLLERHAHQRGESTLAAACERSIRETYAILMAPQQRLSEDRPTRTKAPEIGRR